MKATRVAFETQGHMFVPVATANAGVAVFVSRQGNSAAAYRLSTEQARKLAALLYSEAEAADRMEATLQAVSRKVDTLKA